MKLSLKMALSSSPISFLLNVSILDEMEHTELEWYCSPHSSPQWKLPNVPSCLHLAARFHTSFLLFFSYKKCFLLLLLKETPWSTPLTPRPLTLWASTISPSRECLPLNRGAEWLTLDCLCSLSLSSAALSDLEVVPVSTLCIPTEIHSELLKVHLPDPCRAFLKNLATSPALLKPGWPLIPLLWHSMKPHAYANGPCLNVIRLTLLYEFRIIHIA